jgi:hypothetical protein
MTFSSDVPPPPGDELEERALGNASLVPFACVACGKPIPAVDALTAACRHCGATTAVPRDHRSAVRFTRAAEAELAAAARQWARYERAWMPRGLAVALAVLPIAQNVVVLSVASLLRAGVVRAAVDPRRLVELGLFATSGPVLAVACAAALFAEMRPQIPLLHTALAAAGGDSPHCRRCGVPLVVPPKSVFVRCIACESDNLVTTSAVRARSLATELTRASRSAKRALAPLVQRDAAIAAALLWGGLSLTVAGTIAVVLEMAPPTFGDYAKLVVLGVLAAVQVFVSLRVLLRLNAFAIGAGMVYALFGVPLLCAYAMAAPPHAGGEPSQSAVGGSSIEAPSLHR